MFQRPKKLLSYIYGILGLTTYLCLVSYANMGKSLFSPSHLILIGSASLVLNQIWRFKKQSLFYFHFYAYIYVGLHLIMVFSLPHLWALTSLLSTSVCIAFLAKNLREDFIETNLFQENPAASRYQVDVQAEMIPEHNEEIFASGRIVDVSASGCFIEATKDLPLGEKYNLQISHHGFLIKLKAQVVRKSESPTGYGLSFMQMDQRFFSSTEEAIERLLVHLGNESYPHITAEKWTA